MSKLLSLIVAALFAAASVTAIAQDKKGDKPKAEKSTTESPKKEPKKEMTEAQKARNKECAAQANEKKLKGDDRKKFMSTCAKPPAKAKTDAKKGDAKPMKAEPKK